MGNLWCQFVLSVYEMIIKTDVRLIRGAVMAFCQGQVVFCGALSSLPDRIGYDAFTVNPEDKDELLNKLKEIIK